ncbi:hypothetical protein ACIQF6_28955 [Kitasatospora sp. NPDC092948]|uniref:hypothetical protein n=1 Tax=Kitasatospora sp. NPDC092948 TaxID=3364088 RepID=UPI0037F84A11
MRGHYLRAASLAVAALLLTGCAGAYQYYQGTGVHDVTAAEAVGSWDGEQQAHLTLHQDGTATAEHLDGREWDYDRGLRFSGTGRWELTDNDGGQQLVVDLSTITGIETRADAEHPEPAPSIPSTPAATSATSTASIALVPTRYRWHYYVQRDKQHQNLALFVFVGDPDVGDHYWLTRTPAEPSASAQLPAVQ